MKCKVCNIEMFNKHFYGDKFTLVCPKCKTEIELTEQELEIQELEIMEKEN